MTPLSSLTVDELADGICLRAARIAAAQAELLQWISEFDRREGWAGPGMLSCAHWLSWRTGLSPGAAREQVRVARRLEDLVAVGKAFGDGRLSFSKVRAITRAASPDDGIDWVDLGRHTSAAQLELIVRGIRRATAEDREAADPELADWKVRTRRRYDADGNLVISITTRAEYALVVEAGLEAKRAQLQRELDAHVADGSSVPVPEPLPVADVPAGTPELPRVTDGEALLALAQQALAAEQAAHPDTARRRRTQLTARIDPLSGWGRQADGELLPPTSLRMIARTLPGTTRRRSDAAAVATSPRKRSRPTTAKPDWTWATSWPWSWPRLRERARASPSSSQALPLPTRVLRGAPLSGIAGVHPPRLGALLWPGGRVVTR